MGASIPQRLRRLGRATFSYLVGWRGILLIGAALVSATVVGVAVSSVTAGLIAFVTVVIPLVIIGFLMSNQASRTQNLVSTVAKTVATSEANTPTSQGGESQVELQPIPLVPGLPERPMVAVVITIWNESRFVLIAIESLLSQSIQHFECIIVDDGSTDDSVDKVLRKVGHDPRFKVLRHETNRGLAAARNTGLDAVTAPYVTFLDGDDFLYPESLQKRLSQLVAHGDKPWVGGVYCQWSNVPELAVPGAAPSAAAKRRTVTWLNSLSDAPFIATAPLLRVEVARSVGGFPDANTAEDTLFWNKVLREGYIFTPVHHVGVAYRMKKVSMFRTTAVEHANLIANGLALNAHPTGELSQSGPFPFSRSASEYIWDVTFVKRMIAALASAVESGDDLVAAETAQVVRDALQAYHLWELPLDAVVRSQASRVSRYLSGGDFAIHREMVTERVRSLLAARTNELLDEVNERQTTFTQHDAGSLGVRPAYLTAQRRLSLAPAALAQSQSVVNGRVILMPAAAYHVEETGPLSVELKRLGIDSVVMVSDRRWPSVEWAQAAYRTPVVASAEAGPWLKGAAGIVVMNDWGEEFKEYVEAGNDLGVPTFAKVEGVQDFEDDDVHWERMAYQRARWVLAQGPNDVAALPTRDSVVVSNNRLERIWLGPSRGPVPPLVVVNLNFTYGVLEDEREMWMASVAAACDSASMPFVVSLHPAEQDRWDGMYPIAGLPMRHLLTRASVLVSRFSTVPFEAMARGVPFVYHNPHGEKVPTFADPNGAFEISRTESELTEALIDSLQWQESYRERSEAFFLDQIAVDESLPAARRAAEAIAERLRFA